MFIAMNQFKVNPVRADDFEGRWRSRESSLRVFDGFVQFALLKGDEPGDYISHTTWASRDAFVAWTQSDAFRQAHSGGMPDGILEGHPRARFYESVIVEFGGMPPAAG
jgi:heme-degrading monooxygenase HmoA